MTLEFDSIHFTQGGRDVYVAKTRVGDLLNLVPERDNPEVISDANRRLYPAHAREFGDYMWETPDWLSGVLMVGVTAAEFKPGRGGSSNGRVILPDGAGVHLFDGQHRVEGLRRRLQAETAALAAMREAEVDSLEIEDKAQHIIELNESVIPVAFYVESRLTALQQMYSDISHVKPPDAITTARFDTRDAFNVSARALSESHPLLSGRVEMERNTVSAKSEKLLTLNQLSTILRICWYGSTRIRGEMPAAADVTERGALFFDTMTAAYPTLKSVAESKSDALSARERGDLVVGVTMLKVYAQAWHDLVFVKDEEPEKVLAYFRGIPTAVVEDSPWTRAGMPLGAKAPLGRAQVDAAYDAVMAEFEEQAAA